MRALLTALQQEESVSRLTEWFKKKHGQSFIYGMGGAFKHAALAAAYAAAPRPIVIFVRDKADVAEWMEDLSALLPSVAVMELTEADLVSFTAAARGVELMARRMDTLGRLSQGEPVVVLATAGAAIQKGIGRDDFDRLRLRLATGDVIERDTLLERLVQLGYERVSEIEYIGQFSSRGGIVDIYPINAAMPVRVEFFDNEIDSLREFSLETKRSLNNIKETSVLPLSEAGAGGSSESFLSYLSAEGVFFFDEPMHIREQILRISRENPEDKDRIINWEELIAAASDHAVVYSALMLQRIHGGEPAEILGAKVRAVTPYQRQFDLLADDIRGWKEQRMSMLLLMSNAEKANAMREMLAGRRLASIVLPNPERLTPETVVVAEGTLSGGFELSSAKLVVISEKDIFGSQKKRLRRPLPSDDRKITHFREIHEGDYVVHINHGIGKYQGVVTMTNTGVKRDYLYIRYRGDDKIFLPTDQVHLLQKYIGTEGEAPRLSRLNTGEWSKTKAKARASAESIARELIGLYAARRGATGIAYPEDTPWQKEFEDAFPYEETPDQLMAVQDIKKDMEKPVPMDRLVCGDVGFGKTEVAIRAAFKAVMAGRQVAVLVPTTVLAQQHYQTFTERFLQFGPVVDVICRFRTVAEQRATLEKVREGRVDILIGTHALLNARRVRFKSLGLLIVDEEQRFGVKQKEKIKQLAAGIDVLTLSATPIPRTLHMSLVGARDMSIIETPPAERHPIQTYVIEANDSMIARAIRRELKRGGQVYFIYNRIETIERMRRHLEEIVPEARIETAHGQMTEAMLERVMMGFYEKSYDILLSTSIVENGLDVSNANTIIVYNADGFGLSQLYQMRGRVGRSRNLAFAYFVYQRDKILTETAEKRLQAMKEFAELGAGFKIAMRDLEIRGAGDLLGAQQHGHIASVGFEMYCRLLDEAVQSLKTGQPVREQPEPVIDLSVEAYIDGGYIDDPMHKIEIYQRIAAVREEKQLAHLYDDMVDRFGEPTAPVRSLLDVARIKNHARRLGVKSILEKPGFIEVTLLEEHGVKLEALAQTKKRFGKNLQLLSDQQLLRVKLSSEAKRDRLDFILHLLESLAGEEAVRTV